LWQIYYRIVCSSDPGRQSLPDAERQVDQKNKKEILMSKALQTLKHELLEAVPPAIFFFIAFHLIAITRGLMAQQYGIELATVMNATIAALVVAKVVLLADLLPVINRFPEKPLIYNIVWKTLIYQVAAIFVTYLERLWEFYREYGSFTSANEHMAEEIVWPHFWAAQMWLLVLFLLYCTLRELARYMGGTRMRAMFFGPVPARQA
jgi:hypothetical protein